MVEMTYHAYCLTKQHLYGQCSYRMFIANSDNGALDRARSVNTGIFVNCIKMVKLFGTSAVYFIINIQTSLVLCDIISNYWSLSSDRAYMYLLYWETFCIWAVSISCILIELTFNYILHNLLSFIVIVTFVQFLLQYLIMQSIRPWYKNKYIAWIHVFFNYNF